MKTLLPNNEAARLEALRRYQILDTEPEEEFDNLTRLAAHICGTPIALINLVDENRQWFKSKVGLDVTEVERRWGICPQCILQKKVVIVSDTLAEEWWGANRVARSNPDFRFYAGVPLMTPEGYAIGTLCVLDSIERKLSPEKVAALRALGHQVISQLELRRNFAVMLRNITQRQRAEEALRASEERFRLLSASSPIGIFQTDVVGRCLYTNARWQEIAGLTLEESLGEGWAKAIHPEDRDSVLAEWNTCVREGREFELEFRFLTPQKEVHWVNARAAVLRSDAGEIIGYVGTDEDITKRKRAEQQIRQQAALLDITTDAILVRDRSQQILFWNKGAERLYGWQAREALGKNATQLLYKEASTKLNEADKTVFEQGAWHGELHQVTKEGREIIVESRWTLVDDRENPQSILIVNTDITEKKQLEAQSFRRERMESLGTLASGMAHDLNNVLAPILMSVQLMQMKFPDSHTRRLLETMETNVKRGAALIEQVLEFVRGVESERTILQLRHPILAIEQIAKQTFPKSIEVCADIPSDLMPVSGNATQLQQVLMNLVVNARDAMPEGGILRISAQNLFADAQYARMYLEGQAGAYVVITVSDTGTGIPPEIVEKIFEPFFTTKDFGKGTGLGLSTAIGIVKSHGGFINVASQVGGVRLPLGFPPSKIFPQKGTQFQVFLPAVEVNPQPLVDALELPKGHGELILVVDDEAPIREITKTSLENYNYKVLLASDGIEAIALYVQQKTEISIVLVDMMMPSLDGTITIRTLQKINPQIKIIAVSGMAANEQVVLAAGFGVKAFLSKPYTVQELLKTLHSLLLAK